MKKTTLILGLMLSSCFLFASGLDQTINAAVQSNTSWFVDIIFYTVPLGGGVQVPWVLLVLLAGALYFTLHFRYLNLRHFKTAIRVVMGRFDHLEPTHKTSASNTVHITEEGDIPNTIRIEGHTGEVSHFQALTAALSGTVGLGNIAGVAVAIGMGGPGATFWMIVSGLLGMSLKMVECTLGVAFRDINSDGKVYGGPMYYLRKGFSLKQWPLIGKILSVAFAVLCVGSAFGAGNMFQANQSFKIMEMISGGSSGPLAGMGWAFGLALSVMVGIVIVGGIQSIARVTDKLVPFMVGIYIVAGLFILALHFQQIPNAFMQIMRGAFSPEGIQGGFFGVLIQGIKRASFSNEAGIGSASIAHAAVKTSYPGSEGLVSLLEPFIDTVVVCTMTALVIIICNTNGVLFTYGQPVADGVVLTSKAFESSIPWFPYVLAVAVLLFAFSTMISWSYYGFQAWSFLLGRGVWTGRIYQLLFCCCIVVGSAASMEAVINVSDAMLFAMMVPNMIGLVVLSPFAAAEIKRYLHAIEQK
jgi:AGCS family alanine or glycine:cation symporter